MVIRYEDMRIEKGLVKEYQKELAIGLSRLKGHNDINLMLKEFEILFARYIGTKHALAVNSGSDALRMSLLALGIGKGDSVIVPNVTYPAVALSVIYTGATPIFVDIEEESLQIDFSFVEKKIQKNTKAIIMAHMFARSGDIDSIIKVAREHNLFIIEDCCQAESSSYKGRKLGVFGDISCFSFSYYKPLSSCGGGGGMICFDKEKYFKTLNYTKVWKDDQALLEAGQKFARMSLMDLVALKTKFRYLNKIMASRIKIKNIYQEELEKLNNIRIFKDNKESISVPQNFLIFSRQRDRLGNYLKERGVVWQKPYKPLHLMSIFSSFAEGDFPCSLKYYQRAIQLPLFSFMKAEECRYITEAIKEFYSDNG